MKKIKFLLLFISLTFLNMGLVKAEDRCSTLKMVAEDSSFETIGDIKLYFPFYGNAPQSYQQYLFVSGNKEYITYCRNAGISTGKTKGQNKNYSCKETIFNPKSTNEAQKIYHAGIMGILLNGYSNFNNNYTGANKEHGYIATNVALRVYEMLWEKYNTNGVNDTPLNYVHQYIANLMLDDAEVQKLLSEVIGKIRNKFSVPVPAYALTQIGKVPPKAGDRVTIDNNSIIQEAKRLLIKGLEQAKDFKKNGAATVKYNKPTITKQRKDDGSFVATLTLNLTAEKFRVDNSELNLNFDCPQCNRNGVTYKTYINNKEMNINGVNLLKERDKKNIITLKIVLTSNNQFNCNALNYNLKIKYKDNSLLGEAYSMEADGFSSSANIQQFYLLYSKDTVREEKISGKLDICSLECEDIKRLCEAGNSEMCKRLEDEFGGDCFKCTALVSPVKCDKNKQNFYIKEGLELNSSAENCEANEDTKLNILKCVVNNKDQANNSFQATDLTNNKYCKVFCKEDYHFVLPGIKEVRSGRYFTLQASVKGSKSCYTSKIDTNEFEKDLEEARLKVIEAFNVWSRLNAVVNAPFKNIHEVNETYQNGETYTGTCGIAPNTYSCSKCRYTTSGDCKTEIASKTFTYKVCNSSGCYNKTETETYGYVNSVSNNCGEGQCEKVDYLTHYESLKYKDKLGYINNVTEIANLDPNSGLSYSYGSEAGAVGELQSAINNYFLILNRYNSCGGYSTASYSTLNQRPFKFGWKMDYNYDAKVKYWYQEKFMLDVTTKELNTLGNVKIDDGYEQTNCYGNVSNDYKCQTESDNNKTAKVNQKSQFMCIRSDNGKYECGTYYIAVSNAKYVSQKKKMEGEYITPTQFQRIYPTNAIVVAGENEKIENGSPLINGLPVSSGTAQGVYTYALKVENLGEYYDNSSKFGRVWGAEDSVVVKTLENLQACYKNKAIKDNLHVKPTKNNEDTKIENGVYVCAYRVNCPDCPIECDEEGCEWSECPENKCPIDCDNCIITNGDYNFNYRPISPSIINPNNRPMGSNWNWDKNITDAVELKAYTTTKEIETSGEEIYDTTKEQYVLKVTMDGSLISAIREYNEQMDNNYLNNSLKCYDFEENGNKYKNVFCYSTFLDEMMATHGDKFKFNKQRPASEAERKNSSKSNYWTTWSQAVANETWNITTINSIEIAQITQLDAKSTSYYKEIGIGPSWK